MLAGWRHGETRNIAQEMMQLTLGIVVKTLFGVEFGSEAAKINEAVNIIMRDYTFLVALPAAELLSYLPLPQLRRFRRARATLDKSVYKLICRGRGEQDVCDSKTLLSMLMAPRDTGLPSDGQLRDEILTIMLAGYETVANALTWTFYLLSQNLRVERILHAELDSVLAGREPSLEDVPRLPYTTKVLAESMRLYPPAWAMGRRALHDFSLGPWRFPARATVLMSQYILHRDPRFWQEPLSFIPERFDVSASGQSLARGEGTTNTYIPVIKSPGVPRFCYFPFGAGPRQCIGESFAWMEGVLVIAAIARNWRLRLASGQRVEPQPLITLRPKYGMNMRLEQR